MVVLVGLLLLVVGGRWWFAPEAQRAADTHITTPYLVVVGTEQHDYLSDVDRTVLDEGGAQVGIVRIPTGDDQCAAAGWASLGAGVVVETGVICYPEVTPDGAIADWRELQEAAGGRLGMLADAPGSCIAAVGPGAALGAARSDGTVSVYQPVAQFLAGGNFLSCPITLVAATDGQQADEIVADLAARDNVTVIRVGLGPDRSGAVPQLMYRTATTLPGLSTGRAASAAGFLDLSDLAGALRTFHVEVADESATPLQVVEQVIDEQGAQELLNGGRALADRDALYVAGLMAVLIMAAALAVVGFGLRRGWPPVAGQVVAAAATTWPGALLSVGLVDWWLADESVAAAIGVSVALVVGFSVVVVLVHRWRPEWPAWLIGVAGSGIVLGVHAAWGAPARQGSLLDRLDLDDTSLGAAAIAVAAVALVVVLGLLGTVSWRWVVLAVVVVVALLLGGTGWSLVGVLLAVALVFWLLRLSAEHPAYRFLGAAPAALVLSVLGAVVVLTRMLMSTREVSELILVLLGLACWTLVQGWLVPGQAGAELDLAALRIPVLVGVVGVAVVSPDPGWAWLIGSLFFAMVAGAAVMMRQRPAPISPS